MPNQEQANIRLKGIEDPLLGEYLKQVGEEGLTDDYTHLRTLRTGSYARLFGIPKLRDWRMLADEIADLKLVKTVIPDKQKTGLGNNINRYYDRTGVEAVATLLYFYRGTKVRESDPVTIPIPWQSIVTQSRMALGESPISEYINDPKPGDIKDLQLWNSMKTRYPGPPLGRPPSKNVTETPPVEPVKRENYKVGVFALEDVEQLRMLDREKVSEIMNNVLNASDKGVSISHRDVPAVLERAIKEMITIYRGKPPVNYDRTELLNYGQVQWGLNIIQEAFNRYGTCESVLHVMAMIVFNAQKRQSSAIPGPKT